MRSSPRSIGPAALLIFVALMPLTSAIAEDIQFEGGSSGGSQIEPAGAEPYAPKAKNLNTVPEGAGDAANSSAPDSAFVNQILAARPNEDLVICIAGCFGGRDRVIYAQPTLRPAAGQLGAPAARQKIGAATDPTN
jgi:hypothetical protein